MNHFSFRQIHLDFHTGPAIPAVGDLFDAEQFANTLAEARVNTVTLFAKCHHGHIYHETETPARHPFLTRPLLEEQIAALRARNIRTPQPANRKIPFEMAEGRVRFSLDWIVGHQWLSPKHDQPPPAQVK